VRFFEHDPVVPLNTAPAPAPISAPPSRKSARLTHGSHQGCTCDPATLVEAHGLKDHEGCASGELFDVGRRKNFRCTFLITGAVAASVTASR